MPFQFEDSDADYQTTEQPPRSRKSKSIAIRNPNQIAEIAGTKPPSEDNIQQRKISSISMREEKKDKLETI